MKHKIRILKLKPFCNSKNLSHKGEFFRLSFGNKLLDNKVNLCLSWDYKLKICPKSPTN